MISAIFLVIAEATLSVSSDSDFLKYYISSYYSMYHAHL